MLTYKHVNSIVEVDFFFFWLLQQYWRDFPEGTGQTLIQLYEDLNLQLKVKFCVSTTGRKSTNLNVSQLWKILLILCEAFPWYPLAQEALLPLRPRAISFLSLGFQFGTIYIHSKKCCALIFLTRVNHHKPHLQMKKQTKTPLEKNCSQTDSRMTMFEQIHNYEHSNRNQTIHWEILRWEILQSIPKLAISCFTGSKVKCSW